jgi:oxalate decarboxylase/phosphoglucose isomerase-like protein (cupin superfamily)
VRLYDGRGWRDGRAGDFLYVPEGGIHGFRNESGQPASMLILFAPGAPRERYFEGLVELAHLAERPSTEEMAEFYREHDTYWV